MEGAIDLLKAGDKCIGSAEVSLSARVTSGSSNGGNATEARCIVAAGGRLAKGGETPKSGHEACCRLGGGRDTAGDGDTASSF